MANPFVAEIRIFPFNFAPKGWAFCDGQLMPISQNTALFSLLGTTYGGDGKTTFALPNLQGASPMLPDQGPGLSSHVLGEAGGAETVTLLTSELPAHGHDVFGAAVAADRSSPAAANFAEPDRVAVYSSNTAPGTLTSPAALASAGGSEPHNNLPPYLVLNFCIALQGVFPARS